MIPLDIFKETEDYHRMEITSVSITYTGIPKASSRSAKVLTFELPYPDEDTKYTLAKLVYREEL